MLMGIVPGSRAHATLRDDRWPVAGDGELPLSVCPSRLWPIGTLDVSDMMSRGVGQP